MKRLNKGDIAVIIAIIILILIGGGRIAIEAGYFPEESPIVLEEG